MEGEWSCHRSGHFNGLRMDRRYRNLQLIGGRIVVTEVASLKEGEWSCYRCQFNGEHSHVTGVAS